MTRAAFGGAEEADGLNGEFDADEGVEIKAAGDDVAAENGGGRELRVE
jgi:hypothetical protein